MGRPYGPGGPCGAKTRQGTLCAQPAGYGTSHLGAGRCKHHGGSTATVIAAARREMSQRVAAQAVADWGLEVETTPQVAVLGHLSRLAVRVRAIEHLVSTTARGDGRVVDAHELAESAEWGPPAPLVRETLPRRWGTEIRVVKNPLLDVLREAEADLRAAAKVCHDMGIAEELVRLEEAKAELTVMAIVAALELPGVAPTPELKLAALGRAQEVLAQ